MGFFGSSDNRKEAKAVALAPAAPDAATGLLDTRDLKYALSVAMNLGKPPAQTSEEDHFKIFDLPFYCKRVLWDDWLANSENPEFKKFRDSDSFKHTSNLIVKSLDMDGDGKLTPKDFQIMYDNGLERYVTTNQVALDKWLPFAGQLVFGFTIGLGLGALTRNSYKGKFWIAGIGFCGYTAIQYLVQQNFVNKELLEAAFKEKVRELADVNGDSEINREDVNELVANRIKFVATKLGPGGMAPGAAGYASLGLGFLRGVRFI